MRRHDRALAEAEAREILAQAEYGVLSSVGPDGKPYGVPLSFVLDGNALYFHSALRGRKLENLAACPAVSFVVAGKLKAVYDGNFGTLYESVIVEGHALPVPDQAEKYAALWKLGEKYLPEHAAQLDAAINRAIEKTAIYKVCIESLSGKARRS